VGRKERFLLFTAYFDEADTHGPSPTIIMAGFLGHARQWEIFDRRLRALQRRDGSASSTPASSKANRANLQIGPMANV
jgi:hypothetical protein